MVKYKIKDRCKYSLVIGFDDIGFIEIYNNGTMYTNIEFNGSIKLMKKILRIKNKERIKNKIKYLFRR